MKLNAIKRVAMNNPLRAVHHPEGLGYSSASPRRAPDAPRLGAEEEEPDANR